MSAFVPGGQNIYGFSMSYGSGEVSYISTKVEGFFVHARVRAVTKIKSGKVAHSKLYRDNERDWFYKGLVVRFPGIFEGDYTPQGMGVWKFSNGALFQGIISLFWEAKEGIITEASGREWRGKFVMNLIREPDYLKCYRFDGTITEPNGETNTGKYKRGHPSCRIMHTTPAGLIENVFWRKRKCTKREIIQLPTLLRLCLLYLEP